jgi:hypothetical protein
MNPVDLIAVARARIYGLLNKKMVTVQHNLNLLQKCLSSPNDSIGDPCFKVWIPDYTLGNDSIL